MIARVQDRSVLRDQDDVRQAGKHPVDIQDPRGFRQVDAIRCERNHVARGLVRGVDLQEIRHRADAAVPRTERDTVADHPGSGSVGRRFVGHIDDRGAVPVGGEGNIACGRGNPVDPEITAPLGQRDVPVGHGEKLRGGSHVGSGNKTDQLVRGESVDGVDGDIAPGDEPVELVASIDLSGLRVIRENAGIEHRRGAADLDRGSAVVHAVDIDRVGRQRIDLPNKRLEQQVDLSRRLDRATVEHRVGYAGLPQAAGEIQEDIRARQGGIGARRNIQAGLAERQDEFDVQPAAGGGIAANGSTCRQGEFARSHDGSICGGNQPQAGRGGRVDVENAPLNCNHLRRPDRVVYQPV